MDGMETRPVSTRSLPWLPPVAYRQGYPAPSRTRRTDLMVTFDVLQAIDARGDVSLAHLSRRVNVPYRRLGGHMDRLRRHRLVEGAVGVPPSEGIRRFGITAEGRKLMTELRQFDRYLRS